MVDDAGCAFLHLVLVARQIDRLDFCIYRIILGALDDWVPIKRRLSSPDFIDQFANRLANDCRVRFEVQNDTLKRLTQKARGAWNRPNLANWLL